MFREDANNRWKNIYEQLLKSRDLIYNLRIDIKDVKDLFKGRKKIIEKDRILEMYKYLVLSSKQSYDKWMKRCRDDLFNYCKLNYTEYMALFDIAAFDKFKVENRMSLIS